MGNFINNNNFYVSLSCSRDLDIKTRFGSILRYILFKYLEENGIKNIINHASNYDLIPYYERWGFILTDSNCENKNDKLEKIHKEYIGKKEKIPEEIILKYKTKEGYKMKNCNIKTEQMKKDLKIKDKLKNTLKKLKESEEIYIPA